MNKQSLGDKFSKQIVGRKVILVAAAAAMSYGCATTGTKPVVQQQAISAWEQIITDRNYTPLPAPRTNYDVGRVYVENEYGDADSISECDSSFDHIDRNPPSSDHPPTIINWGATVQNTQHKIGGGASTGATPLPSGLTASLQAGFSKEVTYSISFRELHHREIARADELLDLTSVDDKCNKLLVAMETTGLDGEPDKTVKDALFVVTDVIEAQGIAYTFLLNPDALKASYAPPASGSDAAAELQQKCGVHANTAIGGFIADLTGSSANFDVNNCKSGAFTLYTDEPLVIAHRYESLADWSQERGFLSGGDKRRVRTRHPRTRGQASPQQVCQIYKRLGYNVNCTAN